MAASEMLDSVKIFARVEQLRELARRDPDAAEREANRLRVAVLVAIATRKTSRPAAIAKAVLRTVDDDFASGSLRP